MFVLPGFAALMFVLDQWTKRKAQSGTPRLEPSLIGLVRLRCVTNRNRLYRNQAVRHTMIAAWIFAACSTVALHSLCLWFDNPVALAGLGCALGSAAGNLYDIVRHRCVLDFIDLGWWPVFNLADVGIVGGLALALWR